MSNEDVSRPIILYVDKFQFENIELSHLERKRVTVVDIDMSYQQARELRKYLEKRIDDERIQASIHIRIYGHMVLS